MGAIFLGHTHTFGRKNIIANQNSKKRKQHRFLQGRGQGGSAEGEGPDYCHLGDRGLGGDKQKIQQTLGAFVDPNYS